MAERIAWTDLTAEERARFRSQIRQGRCHEWTGETNSKGYGRFVVYRDGRRIRFLAHRLALTLALGREPEGGTRHRCDNPPCCRSDHLLEGSQRANMLDAQERGRADYSGLRAFRATRDLRAQVKRLLGIKVCSRCQQAKVVDDFHRNRANVDGHQYWCKDCRKPGRQAA